MKYCTNCLQPDTRPNTRFSSAGLCPACVYAKELETNQIDWEERFEIIQEIISEYKKKKLHPHFDCIIGVSGGKDSTRQALWVRDKLKLRPLLVSLNYPPEQITERGAKNLSNLINLGFDMINISLAPQTWKLLMRAGFFKYTNWARATELPLFASVPRIAIKEKIPLIFWGENPSLQLGDLAAAGKTGYDGNNLKNMNTLDGGDLSWMLELGIKESELIQFKYPTHDEFIEADIQIIYLGWFWNDWSLASNGIYSSLNGLDIRDDGVENTGDFTNVTALDEDWVTLNQMIKYYKYGFGRVTDYVNEQIRFNKINREVGIKLLEEYDGNCGTEYIDSFCSYIDITIEQFWKQVHSAVNKELFSIEEGNTPAGQIRPKFKVGEGI